MGLIKFFVLLMIAFICGSIGASLAGAKLKGCITNIILGFIGALIGGWLSERIGIRDLFYFKQIPIVWSIIGSALFVAVLNLISGRK